MQDVRVVRVEARPNPDSPEFDEVGGAFVMIYTTADSESGALAVASSEIAEAGWSILTVEDEYVLTQDEAQDIPEVFPYYEQAVVDGIVLVFHTYPHGGEEPDVLH